MEACVNHASWRSEMRAVGLKRTLPNIPMAASNRRAKPPHERAHPLQRTKRQKRGTMLSKIVITTMMVLAVPTVGMAQREEHPPRGRPVPGEFRGPHPGGPPGPGEFRGPHPGGPPGPGEFRGPRPGEFRESRPGEFRGPRPDEFRESRPGEFRGPRPDEFREPRPGEIPGPRPGQFRESRPGEV